MQSAEHAPHLPLQRTNGIGDRLDMLSRFCRPPFLQHARSGCGIDVDGEQKRAYLVVQVSGKLAAFLFLQGQQLLVQAPIFPIGGGQPSRHSINAVAQARQFGR